MRSFAASPFSRLLERVRSRIANRPSIEQLRTIFDYDPVLGLLIWKHRSVTCRGDAIFNGTHAGKTAGAPHQGGYLQVGFTIDGVKYKALVHRVLFALHHGYWCDFVDHENNDRADNRLDNLRNATSSGNNSNRNCATGKFGLKGVYLHVCTGRYFSQICHNGHHHYLGIFDDPLEAARAYDVKAVELHGAFAKTNAMMGLL